MRAARAALGTLAACAALCALLAGPASAAQQRPFTEVFGSAEEPTFSWPSVLAVQPGGDLLVGDFNTATISRFKPNGEPDPFAALGTNVIDGKGSGGGPGSGGTCVPVSLECDETPQNGIEVSSAGGREQQIAVSPVTGDIYLTQRGGLGKPELVNIFSAEGAWIGQLTKAGTKALKKPTGITVDAAGAVYVSQNNNEISKYCPAANPPKDTDNCANFKVEGYGTIGHLALGSGSSDGWIFAAATSPAATLKVNKETGVSHVYAEGFSPLAAVDPTSGNPVIQSASKASEAAEFDGSGETAGTPLSQAEEPRGVKDFAAGSSGQFYLVIGEADPRVFVFGAPATTPTLTVDQASEITTTEATLGGAVNPEGVEASECRFEALGASVPQKDELQKVAITGASGGSFKLEFKGEEAKIPYGASANEVSWALQDLPAIGERNNNVVGGVGGPYFVYFEGALAATDLPPLEADPAELTPGGATIEVTTLRDGNGWGNATTLPCEGAIPTDEDAHPVEATLTGLEPNGAEYLYRLSATNENGTEHSAEGSFVTAHGVLTEAASEIGRTTATLNGTIRPEGLQYDECFFKWGPVTDPTENEAPCVGSTPPDSSAHPVAAELTGLAEGTEYRFRLFAKPHEEELQEGKEFGFKTAGAPSIPTLRASGATRDSLTLEAEVDPGGLATSVSFEWGPTAAYGGTVSRSIEAGTEPVRVSAPISGLAQASTYHFRVRASNDGGSAESEDELAETLNSCGLPEGRCLELASPRELGPLAAPGRSPGRGIASQAGSQAGALLYQADLGLPDATKGGAVTYLASRGTSGWSSAQLSPGITERVETSPFTNTSAIVAASADLSCAVITSTQLLTEDPAAKLAAEAGAASLYRRNPDGSFTLISNRPPEGPNVTSTNISNEYKVIGISQDCERVAFETRKQFSGVPGAGEWRLYEWDEGALANVGWVPDGSGEEVAEAAAGFVEGAFLSRYNAVSADATRVFFSAKRQAEKVAGEVGKPGTFARIDGSETLDVSASETSTPDSGATFQGATPDGRRAYFVANAGLTTPSSSEGRDLYECHILAGPECELRDLSVAPEGAAKAGALIAGGPPASLVGMADDGSRAYFIARGQLEAGEGPTLGENETANSYSLYEYAEESGEARYLATVTGANATSLTLAAGAGATARASPDGRYLLFESSAKVTSYESGGAPEAYLYDAEAGSEEAAITCVSCRQDGEASINAPGGLSLLQGPSLAIRGGEPLAFFRSRDALAAGATDGEWSLYEWSHGQVFKVATEKPGASTPGHPETLSLIGANADATDLYFFDSAALNWENPEGRNAAWDARIGGGFQEPPAAPAPCDPSAEGSCQGPAAPAPSSPAAGSAGFSGEGNVKTAAAGSPASRCTAGARKAKRQSARARKLRRKARALERRGRRAAARKLARKARRYTKAARSQSKAAKRCRARVRKARRAHR